MDSSPPSVNAAPAGAGGLQPQQYCLRWNNHQHNLLSVFEDLLNHEAFVDVTLAVEGVQLKAHKMVLSACSPYFQSLLYNTPDRHPIVFLRDVRYHEMKALLEFMYRGEVSVDQDNLTSLLKVAEGLKIKGLADVSDGSNGGASATPATPAPGDAAAAAASPHLPPPPPPPMGLPVGFPSLLSSTSAAATADPQNGPGKHLSPPAAGGSSAATAALASAFLGPSKRKRGRPRRLSGTEAVPMAPGLTENNSNNTSLQEGKDAKTQRQSTDAPTVSRPLPMFEADSIVGSSGVLRLKKESTLKGVSEQFGVSGSGGTAEVPVQSRPISYSIHGGGAVGQGPSSPLSLTTTTNSAGSRAPSMSSPSPQPPPAHSHPFPTPPHRRAEGSEGANHKPASPDDEAEDLAVGVQDDDDEIIEPLNLDAGETARTDAAAAAAAAQLTAAAALAGQAGLGSLAAAAAAAGAGAGRGGPGRGRGRRGRGRHRDRVHQRSLSEMSVRGLDLLRYATLAPDGTYRCIECERLQMAKNFKNKYSFQRHAFLYHEGAARKVFPCTICKKEFSRPDKMKQHLKQAHEGGGGGGGGASGAKDKSIKAESGAAPSGPPSDLVAALPPPPPPPLVIDPSSAAVAVTTASMAAASMTEAANAASVAAAARAAVAAMAASAMSAAASGPSAALLVNPFLTDHLNNAAAARAADKMGTLKDS